MCVMLALPLCLFPCFVWTLTPLAIGGLSGWVSRTVCLSTRPSARRCQTVRDARVRLPCSSCQLSPPSGASGLASLLSITMSSPLALLATSGRTNTSLRWVLWYWQEMTACPLASPKKPTGLHLWPIVSVDEKHYNHWWHGKNNNYVTYNKHVSLILP
jgi:hypothetical protein